MDPQAMVTRQEAIVREMTELRFMQKGTISRQRMPSSRGGVLTGAMRGPYPVLTWKENGKTRSLRLKNEDEVAWAEQAVDNQRRFAALCREYQELGEQLAQQLRVAPKETEVAQSLKKKLKWRSNRASK